MNLFTFNPGDLIVSAQINANFQEFVRVLGQNSTATELALPGRLTLGSSGRATLSALSDKVEGGSKYFHIGWNAEEFLQGSKVQLQRRVANSPSAALRLGDQGVEVFYNTASQSATSLTRVWGINSDRAYLNPNWSFSSRATGTRAISDYRLMLTPLTSAVTIHNVATVAANAAPRSIDLSKTNFGTTNYHGVEVHVTATAGTAGSEVSVYGQGLDPYTGVILTLGSNQRMSARGCVVLKRGSSPSQTISITNTGGLSALTITVVGLWK
jgi:hypothetical protein